MRASPQHSLFADGCADARIACSHTVRRGRGPPSHFSSHVGSRRHSREASRRRKGQDGSLSRLFGAVPRWTAHGGYSAARATSAKRLCRMYPSSAFQPQSLHPHGVWIQEKSERVECMPVMQPCTRVLYASTARAAVRSALHFERQGLYLVSAGACA